MEKFSLKALTRGFLLLLTSAPLLSGCSSEYDKKLYGDYRIARTNAYEAVICDAQHVVTIDGNLQRFAIKPPLVTGCTIPLNPSQPSFANVRSYFVLNASTGEKIDGLDEALWRDELKKIGWRDPQLKDPD